MQPVSDLFALMVIKAHGQVVHRFLLLHAVASDA